MGKPIHVLRDGRLKVAIWKVDTGNGFLTASVARAYQDKQGEWQERASFSLYELGRVIVLLEEAKVFMEKARSERN